MALMLRPSRESGHEVDGLLYKRKNWAKMWHHWCLLFFLLKIEGFQQDVANGFTFSKRENAQVCTDRRIPNSFTICGFVWLENLESESEIINIANSRVSIKIGSFGLVMIQYQKNEKEIHSNYKAKIGIGTTVRVESLFEIALPPKRWRHICLLADKGEVRCFVDGKEEKISYQKTKGMVDFDTENRYNETEGEQCHQDCDPSTSSEASGQTLDKNQYRNFRNVRADKEARGLCIGSDEFYGHIVHLNLWENPITSIHRKDVFKLLEYDSVDNEILISRSTIWDMARNSQRVSFKPEELYTNETPFVSFRSMVNYYEALNMCDILGGKLISENDIGMLRENKYASCDEDDDAISWLSTESNWTSSSIQIPQCLKINKDWVSERGACVKKIGCTFCRIFLNKFMLYGHQGKFFDFVYFLKIQDGSTLVWIGERSSYIEKRGDVWVLISKLHNVEWILRGEELPVGRRVWEIPRRENANASSISLALNTCKTSEFSCDNGECINIANRCDDKHHCQDESDEKWCQVLYLPPNYDSRNLPPERPDDVLPLPIEFQVVVNGVGQITSDEGVARMDVGITMMWYEPRVSFRNLVPDQRHYVPCQRLWLPALRVSSGVGSGSIVKSIVYQSMCYVFLEKQHQEHVKRSLWDPMMAHMTSGATLPIIQYVGITTQVPCSFDLPRYPFDVQYCNASFMITNGASIMALKKSTPGKDVPYMNKHRILLEYQLKGLTTDTGHFMLGKDNNTFFYITFHFHRMYGFHILNSYFPSLLMTLIAYSTFHFPIYSFFDRILVSLTTQLVVASLLTSIISLTVKTPYLKLIDVWFAVIITIISSVTFCQVAINGLLHRTRIERMVEGKIFRRGNFGTGLVSRGKITQVGPLNDDDEGETRHSRTFHLFRDRNRAEVFNRVAAWIILAFTLLFTIVYGVLCLSP